MDQTVHSEPRRLKSDNPTVRNRWIELMRTFVLEHKLDEKIAHIERNMQLPLPQELAQQYEKILQL